MTIKLKVFNIVNFYMWRLKRYLYKYLISG